MRKQLVKCFKDACNALTDARLEALEKEKELSLDECEEIMADHLITNGVTVQGDKDINVPNKWISVKDRLPEFCVAVLAYAKYYVSVRYEPTVVRWTGDYWCDATGVRMQVTHWMPLPQPPKGE